MTEVEALLSVDAGRMPPDTLAFFPRDPELPVRRARRGLAAALLVAAAACLMGGAARELVAVLGLAAGVLLVLATPTVPDEAPDPCRRSTLVVTPTGIIVRDEDGLRQWQFADLADIQRVHEPGQVGLLLERVGGLQEFLDTHDFERGDSLWGVVRGLLKAPRGGAALASAAERDPVGPA